MLASPSGLALGIALCGAADEALGQVIGLVVGVLLRRMLHEVGRRAVQDSALSSLESELDTANGVDDDAGRVR
jgi:hypothetical protein